MFPLQKHTSFDNPHTRKPHQIKHSSIELYKGTCTRMWENTYQALCVWWRCVRGSHFRLAGHQYMEMYVATTYFKRTMFLLFETTNVVRMNSKKIREKNILCNSWTKYMRIENLKLLVRIWFWYSFSVCVLYGTSAYVCKKFQWAFVGFLAKNGLCTLLLRLRLLGSSSLALNAQKDFCSLEAPDNRDTCVRIGLCVPFSFRILCPVNFI